jgi:hypothetical protein
MRYTVTIKIGESIYYQHWSSMINAPVTYILNEKDWKTFYTIQYGEEAYIEWERGSRRKGKFTNALKIYNQEHEKIKKEDFIKRYKKSNIYDLLIIVRDYVKAGDYIYKGKIFTVFLTMYHKVLKRKFVICKADDKLTYLDLGLFFSPSQIKRYIV